MYAIHYSIVGNFRGRKLSQIGENMIFTEKTFAGCSLFQPQRTPHPNFAEKTLAYSHKTAKFVKVSPSKLSCYTVLYGTSHQREVPPKEGALTPLKSATELPPKAIPALHWELVCLFKQAGKAILQQFGCRKISTGLPAVFAIEWPTWSGPATKAYVLQSWPKFMG